MVRNMGVGSYENVITRLASMGRVELIGLLREMRCTFPMDFTEEYLQDVSVERLRHIVLAACMHRVPLCA